MTKFIKYVDWRGKRERRQYVIGIVGDDPFTTCFDGVEGQPFMGKVLHVHRYGPYHPDIVLSQAEVLFISTSEQGNLDAILQLAARSSTITVSEIENFTQRGGMIYFMPVLGNRIRYQINLGNASAQNLRITSPLLRYAENVVRNRSGKR